MEKIQRINKHGNGFFLCRVEFFNKSAGITSDFVYLPAGNLLETLKKFKFRDGRWLFELGTCQFGQSNDFRQRILSKQ